MNDCLINRLFLSVWAPDVESCRGRGPPGEGGLCRRGHHEQTQGPERPQLKHDPTDLPSAQGAWKECVDTLLIVDVG